MAYNKSTVGVLVYLYILFIATVELLALIQPSYCAEANDDQQNSLNEGNDDNYLQSPSSSHDFETIDSINEEKQQENHVYQQPHLIKDSTLQGQAQDEPVVSSSNLDSNTMEQEVPFEQQQKKQEQVHENVAEETGDYDAFVPLIAQQQQQQQQQPQQELQQTLSSTSSGIKTSIKVECEPFLDDIDEEQRNEKAAVRLVNSSQIFAYLDRIHGSMADVNDTESKSGSSSSSSSENNNASDSTNSSNGATAAATATATASGISVDGSEKMKEKSEAVSTTSIQGGQSNHVISDNVTDNIIINESNARDVQVQHEVTVNTTSQASHCALVLFYYPWCIFSAKAAPAFNAIGRIFPQIRVMALDAYTDTGLNMRFGLVGVPTILFFHNSKLIAKYNETDVTTDGLLSFIHKITGLTPVDEPLITPDDLDGPVPTIPVKTIDYVAIISCIFVILCAAFFLVNSIVFSRLVEFTRNNWRDAQAAQHQHTD